MKAAKTENSAAKPEVRIPVENLGYMAPGELPEFGFEAMVELHFIDAAHLLFTFNIDALLQRNTTCATAETKRKVRAVVLALPSGKPGKQAEWELYNYGDYLWSLGDGQFLLRRCSQLETVGASLEPRPLIQAAGEIEAIGFSPNRSMVVVEEKSQAPEKAREQSVNPVLGPGGKTVDPVDVSFIALHPPRIVTRTRLPFPAAMPIVENGILETLAGPKNSWTVDLQPFRGAESKIAVIHSECAPRLTPIGNNVMVAAVCSHGKLKFEGYDRSGLLLWQIPVGEDLYYPTFLLTRNGVHFAIESLHANRPLAALDPLSNKVIDAQVIDIYDTMTGVSIGSLRVTPPYTGGRNADFSPDGTRIAVLNDGAIEIYSLNGLGAGR